MKSIFKIELVLSFIVFVILLIVAFNTNTTGNAGDSITHYLYAHYSFEYPEFFFNHWAKPLFVLLSSPFAQFGFKGIIIFNIICIMATALFTFYTAKNLNIKNPIFVFLFIFFSPLCFKLIFSGLTEYLFGLFLILGIYLYQNKKCIFSLIIISFLPLIRTEGLLILAVFGLLLIIKKEYKVLPFLITGQLLYTFAGMLYYKDFLWLINEIPYANLGSPYGKGNLFDFIHRLNYVIEKPIYLLLSIGVLTILFSFIKTKFKNTEMEVYYLILGSFLIVFIAHSIFWWQGIFNSMGLPRVLIAIIPIIAIISLIGLQTITDNYRQLQTITDNYRQLQTITDNYRQLQTITDKIKYPILKNVLIIGIALLICFYPFTKRVQGVVFDKELFVLEENRLIDEEIIPFINKYYQDYLSSRIYYSHPYLSLALKIDPFNADFHKEIKFIKLDTIPKGSIIIWDEWYSVIEGGVSLKDVEEMNDLQLVKTFVRDEKDRRIQFSIFQK